MSRRREWYAALFSMNRILGDEGWCYLWTFTTEDVVEPPELINRWKRFREHRTVKALKLRALRVVEKHPGGHGYHMHFVTPERLDASTLWEVTAAVGLGRIDVQRIPRKRAVYVLKYLRKQERRRCRSWAVLGVKGVACAHVVIEDTFSQEVASRMPPVSGYNLFARYMVGLQRVVNRGCCFEGWKPAPGVWLQDGFFDWLGKLGDGKWVFGEYRGRRVDRVKVTVKGGPERQVFHVVRDFVIFNGVPGVVRHNIEGDAGLPLPPAPVYPPDTPCMVRVHWGRKVGLTWDNCGTIEPWPEEGGSAPVALTVRNGALIPIEACWKNESTAQP